MHYRLGLDIGIASVGWSVLETDAAGEPIRIADLGVRIFEKAEHPKNGASLALPRRRARALRRLVRRRRHRRERVKSLLFHTFGEETVEKVEENNPIDLLKVRYEGLTRALSREELGRLCVYFVKHRGFRSSRKAGKKSDDEGKLLSATGANKQKMQQNGYQTVGEMLYKDASYLCVGGYGRQFRNKKEQYDHCFLREDLRDEIAKILSVQERQKVIANEFTQKYLEIFDSQRSFDEGPGKGSPYSGTFRVGDCTFEEGEKRAPKASYTAEYSRALQKLNSLKILKNGQSYALSQEQREEVVKKIQSAKMLTFKQLRAAIDLKGDEDAKFNLLTYSTKKEGKDPEGATFVSMAKSYEIRKALLGDRQEDVALLDAVAEIITMTKSVDNQKTKLLQLCPQITEPEIQALSQIDALGFAHLSIKALKNIQPYLEQGDKYSEACEKAGYNHSARQFEKLRLLKGEEINAEITEIISPVVRRSISQTLKVINAVVLKYDSPAFVNVELARDMGKSRLERDKIEKELKERTADNERIIKEIKEKCKITNPRGLDIVKYRLYEEQFGKCSYSGKEIDINRLFEPGYCEVDHIIPFSRSFSNGMANKTLCLASENQRKRNRLPYEWFGSDENRWAEFTARVATFRCSYKKKQTYLKETFSPEVEREWKDRNLNDTRYVCRLVYNLINDYLQMDETVGTAKRRVYAVAGGITAYMRNMWGLQKIRAEGDKHHALDATVIAAVTPAMEHRITKYNQAKEFAFHKNGNMFVDNETGEVLTSVDYDKAFGVHLQKPYPEFVAELEIRMGGESEELDEFGCLHQGFRTYDLERLQKMGYDSQQLHTAKPIFVSRAPQRKANGALHADTLYSTKYVDQNVVVRKVPLSALSLDKNGEIANYFTQARESDPALYNALKTRLQQAGGKGEDAFKEGTPPFHRPQPDGTSGPIVKTVKVQEVYARGIQKKNGYAKNESMVRTDVFTKDGKYYCVPVYAIDVAKGTIPNKAITAAKPYEEWPEMDESYEFLFSLYKNDLLYLKAKNPINIKNEQAKAQTQFLEGFVYYNGINSNDGSVHFVLHDHSFVGKVGLKTVPSVQKYEVGILGDMMPVGKEKRDVSGKAHKRG